MDKKSVLLVGFILTAAFTRLIDHPPNFTPIAAIALFGGACFANRKVAFLAPLAAMLLSDLVLSYTKYHVVSMVASQPVVYVCILATTAIGLLITNRRSVLQVGEATLAGSVLFYLVTNFAVWAANAGHGYPADGAGLVACYTAAIPFFWNTLRGDFLYATVLFGGLALLENATSWMRTRAKKLA